MINYAINLLSITKKLNSCCNLLERKRILENYFWKDVALRIEKSEKNPKGVKQINNNFIEISKKNRHDNKYIMCGVYRKLHA